MVKYSYKSSLISQSIEEKGLTNSRKYISIKDSNSLKVKQADLLIFFRQLAVILQSGVPLAQGIELLAENTRSEKFSWVLFNVADRLKSGDELSLCLNDYPKCFAPITIGLIKAGEAGGILDKVLDRIAILIEEQEKIKSQITGALIYPVIILVLAISVSLGLLIFIVPKFELMFKSFNAELPGLTKFMLALSRIVVSNFFLIGAPIVILIILFIFKQYYSTTTGKRFIDNLILRIPLFGELILRSEIASFCDTLSTLMNAGIPIVEGLERCRLASGNQAIKDIIANSVIEVTQGNDLSISLKSNNILPKLVPSMVRIGEESGELGFMLDNLSKFYKREVENTVSSLTKAMEPAVIIVIAGIVGTIVVSLYLPMFEIITVVK